MKQWIIMNKRVYIFLYVVLIGICILGLSQGDNQIITKWGTGFWDAIRDGRLLAYPQLRFDDNNAINYSIFVPIILFLWFLPFEFVEIITSRTIPLWVYMAWEKVLVLFLLLGSVYVGAKCLQKKFNLSSQKTELMILALAHPVCLLDNVCSGQLDLFGVFFLVLGLWMHLNGKSALGVLCFGMSIVIKPFPIILIGLYYVFFLKRYKYKVIFHGLGCAMPSILFAAVTRWFFPTWDELAKTYYHFDFYGDLFIYQMAGVSLVMVVEAVLIAFCFWAGQKDKSTHVFMSLVLAAYAFFFLLVPWHSSWMVYMMVPVMYMVCVSENKRYVTGFSYSFGLAYMLISFFSRPSSLATGVRLSTLSLFHERDIEDLTNSYNHLLSGFANLPMKTIGSILLFGSVAGILIRFLRNNQTLNDRMPKCIHVIWVLPMFLYFIGSFWIFFFL